MSQLVVAIGAVVITLILAQIILLSEPPTIATLLPIPIALLAVGLTMRRRPDRRSRSVGRIVLILSVVGFVALLVLYAIALGSMGRG